MSDVAMKPVRLTLTKSQLSTFRGRELFAILSEISADGILSNQEIEQLKALLSADTKDKLPAESHLLELLNRVLANGQVSPAERAELQKEIERVLPPSQRMEAKEARKRVEALLESDEPNDDDLPLDQTLSKLSTKQKAKQEALVAALEANASRPVKEGQKQYNIKLPERRPYEPKATLKQKDYLWSFGVRDEVLLEALGKWQASAMIDQLKAQQPANYTGLIILVVVIITMVGVIIIRFQQ